MFALDLCLQFDLGNMSFNHLLYADDLVLFTDYAKNLKLLLSRLSEYAVNNKLPINAKKLNIMIFGKHHYRHLNDFTIQDTFLDSQLLKFLGVIFASSAKWLLHDQEMACKVSEASLAINVALLNLNASYEINVGQRLLQVKVLPIFLCSA